MITDTAKQPLSINDYVFLLENRTTFISQANYGDGEFSCMMGVTGANCDGSPYDVALGKALRHTILHPCMTFYGYNPGRKLLSTAEEWLKRLGVNVPSIWSHKLENNGEPKEGMRKVPWVHKEIISSANLRGKLGLLIRLLRDRRVVLVGPEHFEALKLFEFAHVVTPSRTAWAEFSELLNATRAALVEHRPHIVLVSCGMAAKPLIWNLAQESPSYHILDTGSIWDPYVNILSRSGYKKPEFQQAMARSISEADGIVPEDSNWAPGHADIAPPWLPEYLQKQPNIGEGAPEKMERTSEMLAGKLAVLDHLPTAVDGPILDIGPAEGWEVLELTKRYGDRVECVTLFDEEQVRLEANGVKRIHVGDMHFLPNGWRDRYGLIFASHVLEHSPAPFIALDQMVKVLAPGGFLALVLPNADGRTRIGGPDSKRMGAMKAHVFFPDIACLIEMIRKVGLEFLGYHEVIQIQKDLTPVHAQAYRNQIWLARKSLG